MILRPYIKLKLLKKAICMPLFVVPCTVDVEHSHVRFLGNLVLNLWDCGG